MIKMRWAPIETWPGEPTKERRGSQFKATYTKTLDLLEAELRNLQAKDAILQARITWEQINNAGWPKQGVKLAGPELILTFESANGPLSFPCDRYFQWQSNLRAIALSLEALRAIDRYGVTRRAEQYQGWRQIEGPKGSFANAEQAAAFIATAAGGLDHYMEVLQNSEIRKRAYRAAAMKHHPDRPPHDAEAFLKLQEALAFLEGPKREAAR